MKKTTLTLILVFALLLCACSGKTAVMPTDNKPQPQETPAPEAEIQQNEPYLNDGETLYENWVYTFVDVDGNGTDERFSFEYVIKNPDNAQDITARLIVESDFGEDGADTPVILERAAVSLIKPEAIYASPTDEGALIVIKDSHAVCGEELYAFRFSGSLSEISYGTPVLFPGNGFSSLASSERILASAVRDGSNLSVSYDGFTASLIPRGASPLCDTYSLKFNGSDMIMSYEERTRTFIIGLSGSAVGNPAEDGTSDTIPFNAIISLRYDNGILQLSDISFFGK